MDHREVFISYHTDSSADTVRKICAALKGAGISCWYAPRDVESNYAESIVKAIRSCKIFLLLLNEQANLSEHVKNEINCAFDRFKNNEQITLLPFRIDECTLSDDVYYYLGRIHIMDGHLPPEMLRIQELVDRICSLLGKEPERTVVVQDESGILHGAPASKQYRLTSAMVYPDTRFVGRTSEIAAIKYQLSSIPNKLALVGMGGIGKSEIARMYLKQNAERYDVILWVSFETSLQKTVVSDALFPIEGLSRTQYPEDDERAYFLRKLQLLKQICDERVLIVVDNFDITDDEDLELFCSGTYAVLFTTRYHQHYPGLPEVQVNGMQNHEDLLALFRAEYQRALDHNAMQSVEEILELLDGHPLSIRLVASAMQSSRRLKPVDMVQMLKSGASVMESQNAKAADIIFGHLRQVFTLSALTEDELYLLKNLSLISLRGIEVERFYDWCGADDFDIIDGLIAKSWVIHDPVADTAHLHPLVADLMAQELEQDLACCNKLVEAIHQACEVDIHYTWEQKLYLHDVAETLYARLPENHPKRHLALQARAQLVFSMAMYEDAAHLFLQILPFTTTLEDKLFIYMKAAHAFVLGALGEQGRETAQTGLSLIEQLDPSVMTVELYTRYRELLCRINEAYDLLGDYETAIAYGKRALEICAYIDDPKKQNIGWVEFHLAAALNYGGYYEEAEKTIRHAISWFERYNDQWSLNYAYDILGLILIHKKEFEEALALNQKAAEILRPFYGTEHADIAKNLEYRGMIYKAMGEKEKSDGCFNQAIEIYERLNCYMRIRHVKELMK